MNKSKKVLKKLTVLAILVATVEVGFSANSVLAAPQSSSMLYENVDSQINFNLGNKLKYNNNNNINKPFNNINKPVNNINKPVNEVKNKVSEESNKVSGYELYVRKHLTNVLKNELGEDPNSEQGQVMFNNAYANVQHVINDYIKGKMGIVIPTKSHLWKVTIKIVEFLKTHFYNGENIVNTGQLENSLLFGGLLSENSSIKERFEASPEVANFVLEKLVQTLNLSQNKNQIVSSENPNALEAGEEALSAEELAEKKEKFMEKFDLSKLFFFVKNSTHGYQKLPQREQKWALIAYKNVKNVRDVLRKQPMYASMLSDEDTMKLKERENAIFIAIAAALKQYYNLTKDVVSEPISLLDEKLSDEDYVVKRLGSNKKFCGLFISNMLKVAEGVTSSYLNSASLSNVRFYTHHSNSTGLKKIGNKVPKSEISLFVKHVAQSVAKELGISETSKLIKYLNIYLWRNPEMTLSFFIILGNLEAAKTEKEKEKQLSCLKEKFESVKPRLSKEMALSKYVNGLLNHILNYDDTDDELGMKLKETANSIINKESAISSADRKQVLIRVLKKYVENSGLMDIHSEYYDFFDSFKCSGDVLIEGEDVQKSVLKVLKELDKSYGSTKKKK